MEYEDIKKKYPSSRRCNTGEAGPIYSSIDSFFDDITFFIDSKSEHLLSLRDEKVGIHPCFERRIYYLVSPSFATDQDVIKNPERISDQTSHILKYKDKTVAAVIETRTVSNFHDFAFFERIEDVLKL